MRSNPSTLDVRYLAIFFGVLVIVVVASLILFPDWRESPAALVLLFVTATVAVVSFASSFRSAFIHDKKDAQPAKLDYDSPQHRRNQENVTANVRTSWIDGVLREVLPQGVQLELALASPPGKLQWGMALAEGCEVRPPVANSANIVSIFRESGRALLILGAPGAGKTNLLLQLCKPLLLDAEADIREPVPVVLNLSTWAQKMKPLDEWIFEEMWRQYGLGKRVTRIWLAHDHLTLLLDGLDEVRPAARDACVKAINNFREDHDAGIVVCSRSADYEELSKRLALSRAVEIEPLDETRIAAYLNDDGLGLAAVREAIARDNALRALSTTPLMLNIMAMAYGGRPIADLLPLLSSRDGDERRKHLYDAYIDRMFRRRPLSKADYTVFQALHWLRFLAQQLTRQNETQFLIEDVQSDWLLEKRTRRIYTLAGFLFSIGFSILIGVGFGVLFGAAIGVGFGVLFGVRGSVLAGLGLIEPFDRFRVLAASPPSAVKVLRYKLLVGVMVSVLGGVLGGVLSSILVSTIDVVLHSTLEGFLGVVLGIILYEVLGIVVEVVLTTSHLTSYAGGPLILLLESCARITLRGTVLGFVLFGVRYGVLADVLYGVVVGIFLIFLVDVLHTLLHLIFQMSSYPYFSIYWIQLILKSALLGIVLIGFLVGVIHGANVGMLAGVLGGVLVGVKEFGGETVYNHFIVRIILHRGRLLPLHLIPFLEAMREFVLVQRVGVHYSFIHHSFQEHIANLTNERIETLSSKSEQQRGG